MAIQKNADEIAQRYTFVRLVAAYEAADRHEMYFTQMLIGWKLLAIGAWLDAYGKWTLDELPAAGSGRPY